MITRAKLGKFSCSRTADEEQNAGALTLSFIDAEGNSGSLAAGRNRHQELPRTRHMHELRSVKTKEEHAGRELFRIKHYNIVHSRHRPGILGGNATYFRNPIFNKPSDL
jgi:hypothetical protein